MAERILALPWLMLVIVGSTERVARRLGGCNRGMNVQAGKPSSLDEIDKALRDLRNLMARPDRKEHFSEGFRTTLSRISRSYLLAQLRGQPSILLTVSDVQKMTGLGESMARRHRQRLEAEGVLELVGENIGGRGKSNEFVVYFEAILTIPNLNPPPKAIEADT